MVKELQNAKFLTAGRKSSDRSRKKTMGIALVYSPFATQWSIFNKNARFSTALAMTTLKEALGKSLWNKTVIYYS